MLKEYEKILLKFDTSLEGKCPFCGSAAKFERNRVRDKVVVQIYKCKSDNCNKEFTRPEDRKINRLNESIKSFSSLLQKYVRASGNSISILTNEYVGRGPISKYLKTQKDLFVPVSVLYKIGFEDAHFFVEEKSVGKDIYSFSDSSLKCNHENWAAVSTDRIPNLHVVLFLGVIKLKTRNEWSMLLKEVVSKIENDLIKLFNGCRLVRVNNGKRNINYYLERAFEFSHFEQDENGVKVMKNEDWYGFVFDFFAEKKAILMFRPTTKPVKIKSTAYTIANRKAREKPQTRFIDYPGNRKSPGVTGKKTTYKARRYPLGY